MNNWYRKTILAITLLMTAIIAIPLVGTVQACPRNHATTFEATFELRNPATTPYPGAFTPPTSTEYFGPTDPTWIDPTNPEGYKYRVQKGLVAWGTIDCGLLGIGKLTITLDYYRHNFETAKGLWLATYYLEFDGLHGDYEGTLTGKFLQEAIIEPPPTSTLYAEGNGIFLKGSDDLNNVKMLAFVYSELNFGVPMPWISYGEMTCTIWGLT